MNNTDQERCLICLIKPFAICIKCDRKYCLDHWSDDGREERGLKNLYQMYDEKFPLEANRSMFACVFCWNKERDWQERFDIQYR